MCKWCVMFGFWNSSTPVLLFKHHLINYLTYQVPRPRSRWNRTKLDLHMLSKQNTYHSCEVTVAHCVEWVIFYLDYWRFTSRLPVVPLSKTLHPHLLLVCVHYGKNKSVHSKHFYVKCFECITQVEKICKSWDHLPKNYLYLKHIKSKFSDEPLYHLKKLKSGPRTTVWEPLLDIHHTSLIGSVSSVSEGSELVSRTQPLMGNRWSGC